MATLQQRLQEAEDAQHDLNLGRLPRAITDANGERIEYSAARPGALAAYIQSLKDQIAAEAGESSGHGPIWMNG